MIDTCDKKIMLGEIIREEFFKENTFMRYGYIGIAEKRWCVTEPHEE